MNRKNKLLKFFLMKKRENLFHNLLERMENYFFVMIYGIIYHNEEYLL